MAPASDSQGLKAMLKGRRGRKDQGLSSSNSVVSKDDTEASNGLRAHFEGAIDKLKEKTRRHSDEIERRGSQESVSTSRLSKFMPKPNRRRDKARDDEGQENAQDSLERLGSNNQSHDSLAQDSSSLLTEDSDSTESPRTGSLRPRPTLSPHQSHIGYLTLSSPTIASSAITSEAEPNLGAGSSDTPSRPLSPTRVDETLASTETATSEKPRRRSSTSVGKLKEAFLPSRRASTSQVVDDTDPVKSGSGLVGLGGLIAGGTKKGSSTLRRGSLLATEPDGVNKTGQKPGQIASEEGPETLTRLDLAIPATPPNLVNAPTTLVTPPTPTDARTSASNIPSSSLSASSNVSSHKPSLSSPPVVASPSGNMISHRRVRSANLPSKLSNSVAAGPLTPHVEEANTPGGSLSWPSGSTGFFSQVFSAVQNTATQLGNSITNASGPSSQRSRSGTASSGQDKAGQAGGEEVTPADGYGDSVNGEASSEKQQLAVHTLGSGDLSLSHLGISDSSAEPSPMTSNSELLDNRSQQPSTLPSDEAAARAEHASAARAVSLAYSEKPSSDKAMPVASEPSGASGRPKSINSNHGEITPPRASLADPEDARNQRSGSVRSRLSARKRRHRGSSVATIGTTLEPGPSASTSTLTQMGNKANGHKGTGFTIASTKRNKDFHQMFRSVPEDDYLLEDYSAALQRDILLHGRLYISEGHICFSSNILGWVTNLVISFDEVVSVEKKNTAVIFPNAIVIQTLHARNVFASFVSRDSTYDLLVAVWKSIHPNLKSFANGVQLVDSSTGDRTEKACSDESEDGTADGSEDDDEDDDDTAGDGGSFEDTGNGVIAESDVVDAKTLSRKTSAAVGQAVNASAKGSDGADLSAVGAALLGDFPGPRTHGPTECGDQDTHYSNQLMDTVINGAPLGKVYSLMFGPESGAFMRQFLIEDQKSLDLQMEDDKKGLGDEKKTFSYSFIKPLNAPIGPKQTKCTVTPTLEEFDLEKAVSVDCSTSTPDVPSGNAFLTKTRYCLMWGPGNSTRIIITSGVEWSGKSWLKGPIEKGCNDGQSQYAKDIVAALRAAVPSKPAGKGVIRKGKGKRKKDGKDLAVNGSGTRSLGGTGGAASQRQEQSWGMLEPLHGVLGPVTDILGPLVNTTVVMGILLVIVTFLWLRQSRANTASSGLGMGGPLSSQRIAAYEEIWKREESELWNWLEERVALDALSFPHPDGRNSGQKLLRGKAMDDNMIEEKMTERQIDDAIRVTEQRLSALKAAVSRKKERKARRDS